MVGQLLPRDLELGLELDNFGSRVDVVPLGLYLFLHLLLPLHHQFPNFLHV